MAKTPEKKKPALWKTTIIPVSLVGIIFILVIPLPTALLDIALATNISISLVILFASLYIERPLNFSSFPAVLLITTLFRLSMNVATTRLILINGGQGTSAAGDVIKAFGEFVVSGNFVVGVVIFILISIVNLKVITKGSGRIAEVAARFTLDAMPGKQMAIDSDLNTGLINEAEAKLRRKELSMEAEFYGAMDGAAKFVSGDAIAGLFITFINIIGGLFIGVVQENMGWIEAATNYTLLTIGDGLVTQIPSIIISTSSGLIVARASSGNDLGMEVLDQLSGSSKPLYFTGAVSLLFALMPGLPFLPFLCLAAGSTALGEVQRRKVKASEIKVAKDLQITEQEKPLSGGSTEEVLGLLGMDTLELEVGFEVVGLVEGGELVERIRSLRRQFALDYGFVIPPIYIRDNVRLKSNEYRLLLRGSKIGGGELSLRHLLAMDPGTVTHPIIGKTTKEPAFGLDALWINESDKERAQLHGYTVVDLPTVITTHLTELIRKYMHELISRKETQQLLDTVAKDNPRLVEDLVPSVLTVGQIRQVLSKLLREEISIRDIATILETLADWATQVKQTEKLVELVRRSLSRTIIERYLSPEGVLPLVSLSPSSEKILGEAVQQSDEGSYLILEPSIAQTFLSKLNKATERFAEQGLTPLILSPGHLRPALAMFLNRYAPIFSVVSHLELTPQTRVQSLGVIALGD
jgi:flagellar biosynthesis protein FlhA